ncbi:hypothetical protein HDV04_002286 [Boothiomyces sp. JEL0838]|nr:hypothetical protein HDV04_002286 [Boothiomyces sp. JEL0838]
MEEESEKGETKEVPRVSTDIPDIYKEFADPEPLPVLDNQMEALLEDIKIILDGRTKEFQSPGDKRPKLPTIPSLTHFHNYKSDRKDLVESIIQIDAPVRKKNWSEAILKEIQTCWHVENLYEGERLIKILISFFKDRATEILMENNLLVSRWSRFCKTAFDANKYLGIFKRRQQHLRVEYSDAIHRLERLQSFVATEKHNKMENEMAENARRMREERDGLAVLKAYSNEEKKQQKTVNEQPAKVGILEQFGGNELEKSRYTLSDLAIYIRWLIRQNKQKAEMNIYNIKGKNVMHSDRIEFIKDYSLLTKIKPGQNLQENIVYYENCNAFIETPPVSPPRLEDFFVEFEILVNDWRIETPIGQEDGRPFAYEVDHKYMDAVYEQCMEFTMIPFDAVSSTDEPSDNDGIGNGIGGYGGSLGLDTSVISMATISGATNKSFSKNKINRLRRADWLELPPIIPDLDSSQAKHQRELSNLKDIDMELKLEYDILLLTDNDQISAYLKESAKRLWERAAAVPNCHPINTKISIIPQSRDHKTEEMPDIRHTRMFDFGLNIPKGDYEDLNEYILNEKKVAYGMILKHNEDTRKLEMEIANADPTNVFDTSIYVNPSLASVFAEHEVLGFLQLRYVKIRQFRSKILRQLNFFRSIEKRLVVDMKNIDHIACGLNGKDTIASVIADMSLKQEFFELKQNEDLVAEDIRVMHDNKIYITDKKGIHFIYDVALKDLEAFEDEMLKVLTQYINCPESVIDPMNPNLDRVQFMLEYYEAYHEYHYAKIQTINCYLEAFENTVTVKKSKEIAQIIANILYSKPIFDFEAKNFHKSLITAKQSLLMHTRILEGAITQLSSSHREWVKRPPSGSHKVEGDKPELQPKYFSSLKIGLPVIDDLEDIPTVVMHHAGTMFGMTEIIPEIENITDIWKHFIISCDEADNLMGKINGGKKFKRTIAECCVLKLMLKYWTMMQDNQFRTPLMKRGTVLEPEDLFLNPYLPDAILKELYDPFDQTEEGNLKSLEIHLEPGTFFNDASFQADGIEILYRLLKVITLTTKINNNWMESENFRKIYESQLTLIGGKKTNTYPRLTSLKFDFQGVLLKENNTNDEDREEDNEADAVETYIDNYDEGESNTLKFGPLAISEIDETIAAVENFGIDIIIASMKIDGMKKLKQILKIQATEKYWFQSAVETNNLIGLEVYKQILQNDKVDAKSVTNSAGKERSENQKEDKGSDLQNLIPTNVNQKKVLRKIMLTEYAKEYKNITLADTSDSEKDTRMKKYKSGLLDFYYNNLLQLTSLEAEKTEFARFCSDFKSFLEKLNYSTLIFAISPITKHSEYMNAGEISGEGKSALKQPAPTQGMIIHEAFGIERLAKLWYIPHTSEVLLDMMPSEKGHKGPIEFGTLVYRNNQVYVRSTRVYTLIRDIFGLVAVVSNILQGNKRYNAAGNQLLNLAADIREADYVVNAMTQIKRDFQAQGDNADYNRVLKGLLYRWQFWILKWKYLLAVSINCLSYRLLNSDAEKLEYQYRKTISAKVKSGCTIKTDMHYKPIKVSKWHLGFTQNLIPDIFLLSGLSEQAKILCDFRIAEMEEDLEEFNSLNQAESRDDVKQKLKIDHVTNQLRLLRFRKHYAMTIMGKLYPFTTEESRDAFFQKYKIKIAIPAIKLYHAAGSKGNYSTEFMLRESTLIGCMDDEFRPAFLGTEFNRIGKITYEKYQQSCLQTEIMRQFTQERFNEATAYFEHLTDERMGRLFRSSDNVTISSISGADELAFKISEEDYNIKSSIFNDFLNELFLASADFSVNAKAQKSGPPTKLEDAAALATNLFDDKRVFACKKTDLGQAIVNLAVNLNKWKSDRVIEQEKFYAALTTHLIEMFRNCERIILHQIQEKREFNMNFERDCRLQAYNMALDAYSAMASMEIELVELKKNKKVDEKRIRNRILDEYDSLIDELVREISVLRHRFHEYQISNFNDVMNIMSDSKKEQLMVMLKDDGLNQPLKNAIATILKHDEQLNDFREQNFELRMTVLKIRSMFTMKEQGMKSFYQAKLRKLSELNKETETKLWDSFRDGETRERALRKQLARIQKTKAALEVKNDLLQRQLVEEQGKIRVAEPQKARNPRSTESGKPKKVVEMESKLRRYEGINIERLIQELANKSALVEELLQEKKDREKLAAKNTPIGRRESKSPSRIPSAHSSKMTPTSGMHLLASAAEPLHLEFKNIKLERIEELEAENRALRRKLFLNGIPLPPESKKSLAHPPSYYSTTPTGRHSGGTTPNRSRPRTAISQASASQVGILKNRNNSAGFPKLPEININQPQKSVVFDNIEQEGLDDHPVLTAQNL